MDDCKNCASLCCIAPSISAGGLDDNYRHISIKIIKEVNCRCEHLLVNGSCEIYESRGVTYKPCIGYTCHGFGPRLTKYLKEEGLVYTDGTLKNIGKRLFFLLNAMLVKNLSGSKNTDLEDAMSHYDIHKKWPDWMLKEKYYNYVSQSGMFQQNPRYEDESTLKRMMHTFRI